MEQMVKNLILLAPPKTFVSMCKQETWKNFINSDRVEGFTEYRISIYLAGKTAGETFVGSTVAGVVGVAEIYLKGLKPVETTGK